MASVVRGLDFSSPWLVQVQRPSSLPSSFSSSLKDDGMEQLLMMRNTSYITCICLSHSAQHAAGTGRRCS